MSVNEITDEETPLLQRHGKKSSTPLPWFQFSLVLVLQLAEPLTSNVIYPFAPQLIRDIGITHGNESQVGYYVGIMQSLFFLTQAFTVLYWSRISDRIGRKPVILTGLFGLSLSMYCFGLSKTFWGLVVSRSLNGALNGNIGVIKSMTAELTDSTNISKAYAYLPISWSTGSTVGPIIGGLLSRPADRFPDLFGDSVFLKNYPYFLPCAIPATFTIFAWITTLFFLKETTPNPIPVAQFLGFRKHQRGRDSIEAALAVEKPLSLRSLLTYEVVVAAANYAFLSLVDISFRAIQPVFLSTPIEMGGLGLAPPTIGKLLSVLGLLNGLFQVCFFAKIHDRWGSKRVFIAGLMFSFPAFALFPVINILARQQGYSPVVWMAIGAQILVFMILNLSYGAIFIFITAASPNRASFGATNGISQMTVSVMRAIGPATANSLFSLSIEKGYCKGYFVYYILMLFVLAALYVGWLLPRHIRTNWR